MIGFRTALALGTAIALVACGSDKPKPTPLESVTAQIAGRQVWNARVDSVQFPSLVRIGMLELQGDLLQNTGHDS